MFFSRVLGVLSCDTTPRCEAFIRGLVNSLLILPEEVQSESRAELLGGRAKYAFDTHGIRSSQTVRVSVLGGLRGEAKVLEATVDRVVLELSLTLQPLTPTPVDLIVGVSRPQTIKKVVQAAVMLGVRSLHFVRSEQGEKSYLQSRSLEEEQVREESGKALEQVWDSRAPEIVVHRTFSHFLEKQFPTLLEKTQNPVAIVAHPTGKDLSTLDARQFSRAHAIVAIGPERGWSTREVEAFSQAGFSVVGLGPRVVRVEIATVLLLGQLQLLRSVQSA